MKTQQAFRKSGFLFALFFFLGFAINFVFGFIYTKSFTAIFHDVQFTSLLASTIFFLLSTMSHRLKWIQVIVFLGMTGISTIKDPRSVYGLGFFVIAIILLKSFGFFNKNGPLKMFLCVVYLLLTELTGAFFSKDTLQAAIAPTYFISAFLYLLWFFYKDKLVIYLKEPKPKFSLQEKGLSEAERSFVLLSLAGKTQKEIAIDFGLSESTIRNTLARAYKKLGVEDKVGLAVLGERNEIVN